MNHDQREDILSTLTLHEKTVKMLEHWIKHNQEHADNYKQWAKDIKDNIGENISVLLKDAADLTNSVNEKFKEAVKLLKSIEK